MNATELKQAESAKIRQQVWDFFKANPCHSRADCAKALGHHRATIGKHAQAIKDGWRPEGDSAEVSALKSIVRAVSYPVCTSLNPQGFSLHAATPDRLELVHEIASSVVDDCRPSRITCEECHREISPDHSQGWLAACGRRVLDVSRVGCRKYGDDYEVVSRG